VVHATGESIGSRHAEGTYAVVLTAQDEPALTQLADRLEMAHVPLVRIYEPDAPWNGALMALGLEPARKEVLRRHLSMMPLLR